ncbi:MAG: peptide-methionine (R)-S-oxide reductase MsrB [Pyrinomonadaceae bacterium]
MGNDQSKAEYNIERLSDDAIERLAQDLNDEERRVLLDHGTEPAFCGTLLDNKQDGTYACRLCGLPLFSSSHKFPSGTGWPSFYQPFNNDHLENIEDNSYGMRRVEIRCARCGGHQGHVFPDGPPPTGKRYCLNSASLEFIGEDEEIPQKG